LDLYELKKLIELNRESEGVEMFPGVVSIAVVIRKRKHTEHTYVLMLKDGVHEGDLQGYWVLPGGEYTEGGLCEARAAALLLRETGIEVQPSDLELKFVASDPRRDPRWASICLVYRIDFREDRKFLNNLHRLGVPIEYRWIPLPEILVTGTDPIALDHRDIVRRACTGFAR